MMRHLTVLGLAAALFMAGEARAQSTCNTTGIAAGCMAAQPFSCPASPTCYSQLSACQADTACGGGTGTLTACNTTGIATGCTAGQPFSCTSSSHCFTTLTVCTTSGECLSSTGGTGGGGGTGGTAATTCNTTGIAAGCSAAQPFSCAASSTCYAQLNACTASAACPTKPPGGGCTAAIGWAPSLALLLLVPWRRRQARRR